MQQRQLRLGDILDDYCTRERRVTNHVIVAMVGQEVKLTRCSTCDAEHVYKHARIPASRKKKESMSAAYSAVLASVQQDAAAVAMAAARVVEPEPEVEPEAPEPEPVAPALVEHRAAVAAPRPDITQEPLERPESPRETDETTEATESPDAGDDQPEGGSRVHRRLIRAQLPRIEGLQPTPRPIPEFTVRDPRGMAGGPRPKGPGRPHGGAGGGRGGGHVGGHKNPQFARDGSRPGGFPPRGPHKPGEGHRRSRPGQGPRPGKKHSR